MRLSREKRGRVSVMVRVTAVRGADGQLPGLSPFRDGSNVTGCWWAGSKLFLHISRQPEGMNAHN